MSVLPTFPSLVRIRDASGAARLALWQDGNLFDLAGTSDGAFTGLDRLLALHRDELRARLEAIDTNRLQPLDPDSVAWLAPVENQEVWAAGVTYLRSREARMEEAVVEDVYARVYTAERPELFFKAAGWRVAPPDGAVGIRADSEWDVPEPELAVLSNVHGEVIAYACGNDMSSRSIEGENPLYLPQAKVYDDSCSLGPAAVLAWHVRPEGLTIRLSIERNGETAFADAIGVSEMVRRVDDLVGVLHASYSLPVGAWLLTGTGIVPPASFTLQPGDRVEIAIDELGMLANTVREVPHSGARAPARVT